MLADNIRKYRKKNNLSQDELAEKVGVSRQSVSFWETGQTQPTIDNILALARIFNISSDMLLGNGDGTAIAPDKPPEQPTPKKKSVVVKVVILCAILAVIGISVYIALSAGWFDHEPETSDITAVQGETTSQQPGKTTAETTTAKKPGTTATKVPTTKKPTTTTTAQATTTKKQETTTTAPVSVPFDLFAYCKNFAIEKGQLNGDYCIYQQPATKYGGYEDEYFSISYWADSDMVEFCLHCPLSETYSVNFYLRMRGAYTHKYEYLSSKYFRDSGKSLRSATGTIDPAVFSKKYPLNCDDYQGSTDGQTEFMEESRVGMCDLIACLKQFVTVEHMECDFSDFEFVNF